MSYARRRLPHGETLLRLPPALTMARVTFSTDAWSLSSSRSGPEQKHEFVTAHDWRRPPLSGFATSPAGAFDAAERGSGNQHEPRPLAGRRARSIPMNGVPWRRGRGPYTPASIQLAARRPCPRTRSSSARARPPCAPSSNQPSPTSDTRPPRSARRPMPWPPCADASSTSSLPRASPLPERLPRCAPPAPMGSRRSSSSRRPTTWRPRSPSSRPGRTT